MSSALRQVLIPVAFLTLFVANGLWVATFNSGVCDELGAHIPAGYLYWASGEFSGGLGNSPLGQLLIAAPTYLLGHSYALFTEQHLLLFRSPVLAMGALLGILVWHMAADLYGRRAGIAALFLYALSPNILAHASLATLDLPTAFFVFLAVYCLYLYVQKPSSPRLLGLALALGLALVTKVQAAVLIGFVPAVIAAFSRRAVPEQGPERVRVFASWLLVPIIVYAVINLVYLHIPGLSEGWLPPQFVRALRAKLFHGRSGHFNYLLGEYSSTGWWYYFPVAILAKTPISTLVLVAFALCRRQSAKSVAFVLVPIGLFLGLGVVSRVNIGLRHVLTLYPFLFVLAGGAAARLWDKRWQRVLLGVLAVWYVERVALIAPHYLSYFNEIAGGPARGHRALIDSNLDWGQNDDFLRRYLEGRSDSYKINPDPFDPTTGHILVNVNALYGVLNRGPYAYQWLRPFPPIRQLAYTWFEYDIPEGAFPEGALGSRSQERGQVRGELLAHLLALKARYDDLPDVEFRLVLAQSFVSFRQACMTRA